MDTAESISSLAYKPERIRTLDRVRVPSSEQVTTRESSEVLPVTERFAVTERPFPQPDPHQIVVKVMRAGLNPVDYKSARSGVDGAGYVHSLGSSATKFQVGDRVMFHTDLRLPGSFAEYVAVPMEALALIPTAITFDEAAALPCPAGTAFQVYNSLSPLFTYAQSDSLPPVILLRGASGAVGSLVVSLLRAHRLTVIGIGSRSRFTEMQNSGVDYCIDYKEGFAQEGLLIHQFLAEQGHRSDPDALALDAIVNLRDSASAAKDMQRLGHRGILIAVVGRPDLIRAEIPMWSDPETAVVPRFHSAPTLVEIALGAAHSFGEVALHRMAFGYKYVADQIAAGNLPRPRVSVVSFDEIPATLELIRLGKASDKFVAVVSP